MTITQRQTLLAARALGIDPTHVVEIVIGVNEVKVTRHLTDDPAKELTREATVRRCGHGTGIQHSR